MRLLYFLLFGFAPSIFFGQFHTLKLPQQSNYVKETQRLGVTDITLEYHSPRVLGRDVWNDSIIIPRNANPIPWRAGANMNTTINFTTNVEINGKEIKAGKYGVHVIPKQSSFTILFAHANNQWGSYYLNIEEDIELSIDVLGEECPFSEKLNFAFYYSSEDSMTIGLEWASKRIPFTISVDLNKTVVTSLRNELRGINTYTWQAWNDAANWCLDHDFNLEEALVWANRSINGGYRGFAANKNAVNMLTKIKILKKLDDTQEIPDLAREILTLDYTAEQSNYAVIYFLRQNDIGIASNLAQESVKKFPDIWFVQLNLGICQYFEGRTKKALKTLKLARDLAPKSFEKNMDYITEKVIEGSFALTG